MHDVRILAAFAACLVLGPGCSDEPDERTTPASVLLITIDTLRADHCSCYGYTKPTTPKLDELARRATRYTDCLATSSWTLPSHASLFTGKFASEHGAHMVRCETPRPNGENHEVRGLSDDSLTLAEAFQQEGYATGALIANHAYFAREMKLDQGFETYDVERVKADALTDKAIAWLDARGGEPWFLFLNYIDAHCPCTLDPRAQSPLPPPTPVDGRATMDTLSRMLVRSTLEPPEDMLRALIEQYDNGIAFADEHIGRLLAHLEQRGSFDETLIVVTSDHGEFFGEHRVVEHARDVYQEVLEIPLIVKTPRQRRSRVDGTLICLADLPNLILRALPAPNAGRWLERFPYAPGNHPVIAECHYSRRIDLVRRDFLERFDRVRRAIYDGRFKYIESSDGRCELYDLEGDPTEARDLLASEPERGTRMAGALQALESEMAARAKPGSTITPKPATEAALRELGYL